MLNALIWVLLGLAAFIAVLILVVLNRLSSSSHGTAKEVRDELRAGREEARNSNKELREEISAGLKSSSEMLSRTLEQISKGQQTQLEGMTKQVKELTESNQGALERVRETVNARVKELQEGNEKKLDEMRKTVDEKLHETLEKRLGESFKLVSERLEAVHKGLGEMQNLASGVGDLKRVLTNVKARGTWAEVQLGAILDQILTPEQYSKNVAVKNGASERVEYAVKLPGPKEDPGACIWLPIDSKFPQEDYLRLHDAADTADADGVEGAVNELLRTVRSAAEDISEKYVFPPDTTDFAIMFLATEGLYAEVLRQPGFAEELQHKYRVVVAGPTTLAALLSALRMGFQTLAIEKRAAEVWKVLSAVKTEFGKFGGVLDKVKRQLNTATRTIDEAGVRSRAMARRLQSVEHLPEEEASAILNLALGVEANMDDDESVSPEQES